MTLVQPIAKQINISKAIFFYLGCRLAFLKERKKEEVEKSILDRVWFSRKTAVLDSRTMSSGSISHVDNDGEA